MRAVERSSRGPRANARAQLRLSRGARDVRAQEVGQRNRTRDVRVNVVREPWFARAVPVPVGDPQLRPAASSSVARFRWRPPHQSTDALAAVLHATAPPVAAWTPGPGQTWCIYVCDLPKIAQTTAIDRLERRWKHRRTISRDPCARHRADPWTSLRASPDLPKPGAETDATSAASNRQHSAIRASRPTPLNTGKRRG